MFEESGIFFLSSNLLSIAHFNLSDFNADLFMLLVTYLTTTLVYYLGV